MVNFPPFLAFLDGIGGPEMLVIFALSLMLFGGKKLPEVARGLGKAVSEFKRAASGVESEIRRAMDMESPPAHVRPQPKPVAPPRKHPELTDPSVTPEPTPAPPPRSPRNTVEHEIEEPDLAEDVADALPPDASAKPGSASST